MNFVYQNVATLNRDTQCREQLCAGTEREIFNPKYLHLVVGTLQPLQADWKGHPRCVVGSSLVYNFLWLASPLGETPRSPV